LPGQGGVVWENPTPYQNGHPYAIRLSDDLENIDDQDRTIVQGYNRDDCLSTWHLRDWLEALRAELINAGAAIERPLPKPGDASEDLTDRQQKISLLIHRLTDMRARTAANSREMR
jgi:hypothetical protein